MPNRARWFVVCSVVSLVSTGAIAGTVYPRWMKTYSEAIAWGLTGSALFLLATLMAGLAITADREAPMPNSMVVLLVFLLVVGVVWAFLETLVVGH
jgi:hypothetical protein